MNPNQPKLSETERKKLLAELRPLAGALLQKIWLPFAQLAVLQLRVPGKNLLVVLDARLGFAALVPERPEAPAGELSPRSQATLRNALGGARFEGARLEVAQASQLEPGVERATPTGPAEELPGLPAVRLSFTTPLGPRALIAERRPKTGAASALLLLGTGDKIIWLSGDAGPVKRPGATYPAAREVPPEPAATREPPEPKSSAQIAMRALAQEENAGLAGRRRALTARLAARVKKLRRAVAAVEEDLARARLSERDLHRAELLLPHQGRIARGTREATVPDWSQLDDDSQPAQVALLLDPALSAAENAARWLKRGKRYQAAQGRIAARQAEVGRALAMAEDELARAGLASDAAQLRVLEDRAGASAAAPEQREKPRAAQRLPYRTFRSTSGERILVGRGARDNDVLTQRIARGNDLWLHARGLQGAHVVVPLANAQTEPDPRTLIEAALLALHFSSAREAELAEVAWTRRKYVRKPKGAPPGAVTFSQERTVRVRREPDRLQALLTAEEK